MSLKQRIMAIHDDTTERLRALASPMAEAMPEKQRIDGFVSAVNEVLSAPRHMEYVPLSERTKREEEIKRRMIHILAEMTLEQTGWRSIFRRWRFHHEPLRHDAANLLAEIGYLPICPIDSRPINGGPLK